MLMVLGGVQLSSLKEFLHTGPTIWAFMRAGDRVEGFAGDGVVAPGMPPSIPSAATKQNMI
jgi:hypothetical protein